MFTMQVIWLSALGGETATCQWQSSCASPSGQMARMQLDSFLPIFPSYPFLSFPHPILLSGGGRATWTWMYLKSKLNSPSNYFLSLCTSNLSSPQTDGNCCCTAGLAPAKLADERQAGVMLVWLISCKEIKEENPAYRLKRVWFGSCSSRMAGSLITEKSSIYLSIET